MFFNPLTASSTAEIFGVVNGRVRRYEDAERGRLSVREQTGAAYTNGKPRECALMTDIRSESPDRARRSDGRRDQRRRC